MVLVHSAINVSQTFKNGLNIIGDDTSSYDNIIPNSAVPGFVINNIIGHVYHSGGVVSFQNNGSQSRSNSIEITSINDYLSNINSVIDTVSYTESYIKKISENDEHYPIKITTNKIRGSIELENIDNLNLPVVTFDSEVNTQSQLWDSIEEEHILVFPVIISYYTHNSGWFIGHEFGCEAGARIEINLYIYDSKQTLIEQYNVSNSKILEKVYQPSSTELEDILIELEESTVDDISQIISKL